MTSNSYNCTKQWLYLCWSGQQRVFICNSENNWVFPLRQQKSDVQIEVFMGWDINLVLGESLEYHDGWLEWQEKDGISRLYSWQWPFKWGPPHVWMWCQWIAVHWEPFHSRHLGTHASLNTCVLCVGNLTGLGYPDTCDPSAKELTRVSWTRSWAGSTDKVIHGLAN